MFKDLIQFIQNLYPGKNPVALHEPVFCGREKQLVMDTLETTMVSSVGAYVDEFEKVLCRFTGSPYAVATTNGTSALHLSLKLAGVEAGDLVLTQALTFVATANAIAYCGAQPVFVDSERSTLGLCPQKLSDFFEKETVRDKEDHCRHRGSNKVIRACVPMHSFGHPARIEEIIKICEGHGVLVIEDAAESLGSYRGGRHTGTFAPMGILSFNGNKIITTGGGGMILLRDETLAKRAKHLSTTAKRAHAWEFYHDEVGYNYRLPNLNAALGVAQMESLPAFIENKRQTAELYKDFAKKKGWQFVSEPAGARSNYWLNAILLENVEERDQCLEEGNRAGVLLRPTWKLMNELPAFQNGLSTDLSVAKNIHQRLVNLPSGVRNQGGKV